MALGGVSLCPWDIIPEESSIPAPEECRDAGRVWGAFQLCATSAAVQVMEPQFHFCPSP